LLALASVARYEERLIEVVRRVLLHDPRGVEHGDVAEHAHHNVSDGEFVFDHVVGGGGGVGGQTIGWHLGAGSMGVAEGRRRRGLERLVGEAAAHVS
jgi:hypothetical protein